MGWFQEPELWFYDHFVQWNSQSNATDPRIMLVLLNEADINKIDYPIRDTVLSDLLEKIESGGANVIGIDLYRDLPEPRETPGGKDRGYSLVKRRGAKNCSQPALSHFPSKIIFPRCRAAHGAIRLRNHLKSSWEISLPVCFLPVLCL